MGACEVRACKALLMRGGWREVVQEPSHIHYVVDVGQVDVGSDSGSVCAE